jgi:hypothetical protein
MASLQADRLRSNPSVDEAKLLAEIDSLKAALFQERQQSQEKTLKMGNLYCLSKLGMPYYLL